MYTDIIDANSHGKQQQFCSLIKFCGFTFCLLRNASDCQKVLKEDFSIEASDQDCEAVRQVCTAVSTRAARLAASGIVALVKKINKLDGCSVAVDGSLYKLHPKFPERYT